MSKKSLNPCPFCGSAAGIQKDITGEEKYHAICNDPKLKCPMIAGLPVWSDSEDEAVTLWNCRKLKYNIVNSLKIQAEYYKTNPIFNSGYNNTSGADKCMAYCHAIDIVNQYMGDDGLTENLSEGE